MKIEKVKIRNFKNLEKIDVDLQGRNVFVMGPNKAGKTSFLQAVWGAVTGKGLPPKPVKKGEKKGLIEVTLDEYIARLKFTEGKDPIFELEQIQKTENVDGDTPPVMVKAPRTFLNDRLGIINFDINEFLSKTAAEQVKYLCKVIGLDFTDLNAQLEEAFEGRRLDKRDLEALKLTADFYDKELAEKELIDIVELSGKIADASAKHSTYLRGKAALVSNNERQVKIEEDIKKLQTQLEVERASYVGINDWLHDVANVPIADLDYDKMKTDLQTANESNDKISEAKNLKEIEDKVEVLSSMVEAGDIAVEDLRREKAKQLQEKLKVDGLEYNVIEELFTWKGLPFDKNQINTADQIIAGLSIGATLLGDLKILRFDGSLIDKKNFELIKKFAAEGNIELFVEIVDRESERLEIVTE